MFLKGSKAMLPITTGVIPFGLIMGTVAANAHLDIYQTLGMNFLVFGGASLLATVDLMTQETTSFVVIFTGLIINLRFLLYSAALSPLFKNQNFFIKTLGSYAITDQTYSVLIANEQKLFTQKNKIDFYLGASITMIVAWQLSVYLGFIFGNIAPASLSLDYAVPLSFVALVAPTLKNKTYFLVALTAASLSVILKTLPFNLGLLCSSLIAITLGAFLTSSLFKNKKESDL